MFRILVAALGRLPGALKVAGRLAFNGGSFLLSCFGLVARATTTTVGIFSQILPAIIGIVATLVSVFVFSVILPMFSKKKSSQRTVRSISKVMFFVLVFGLGVVGLYSLKKEGVDKERAQSFIEKVKAYNPFT